MNGCSLLTRFLTAKDDQSQNSTKFVKSFCKIPKTKLYHVIVTSKRFHLNGFTTGFHPQTQKLEAP